ncbi:hypothetical protein J2R89_001718 [Bradyrhizobium elkanii]|nr:hypothetical protein [Bradyrhizobium elkanii]
MYHAGYQAALEQLKRLHRSAYIRTPSGRGSLPQGCQRWHVVFSRSIDSFLGLCPARTRRLLPRQRLRLKALPKKFDILQDPLAVFGLQIAEDFLCPLGTFCMQSSNVFVASQQSWNSRLTR